MRYLIIGADNNLGGKASFEFQDKLYIPNNYFDDIVCGVHDQVIATWLRLGMIKAGE